MDLAPLFNMVARILVASSTLLFVGFWVGNLAAIALVEAPSFQRLGSFWVALVVLGYGIARFLLRRMLNALDEPIPFSDDLNGEMAQGWEVEVYGAAEVSEMDAHARSAARQAIIDVSNNFVVAYRADIKEKAKEVAERTGAKEFVILVVATLQWGYGDLFHCWINGNGWQVCY